MMVSSLNRIWLLRQRVRRNGIFGDLELDSGDNASSVDAQQRDPPACIHRSVGRR